MKIAIHHRDDSFSKYWIDYCEQNDIDYKIVNCYSSNIVKLLEGCDAFLWNWVHWHSKDVLFAKKLIYSLEQKGLVVYPNSRTTEFFDDKLGQKYLFESLKIPTANSYAFYDKTEALNWVKNKQLPIVFKLRGGAGSVNVKLVKTRRKAERIIKKSFTSGFKSKDQIWSNLKDRIYKFKEKRTLKSFIHALKGAVRFFYINEHLRLINIQKGYVYFQDYVPNNECDIRVTVIGDRAVALKRLVRRNDFRASGSGHIVFNPDEIDQEYINLAFKLNNKLKMQSVAFDFIKDGDDIKVVEISYNFLHLSWPGYWKSNGEFIKDDNFRIADFIISDLINEVRKSEFVPIVHHL